MRRVALLIVLAAAPALVVAQQGSGRSDTFPARGLGVSSAALQQFFVDYWRWRLSDSPELATQMGRTEYNDRWRDWSRAGRERTRRARQEFLQQNLYISSGNLTAAEILSARLLEYELRADLEAEPYQHLVMRLSQLDGAHNEVFRIVEQMPARTVTDYENIISRLRALPAYVDQHIDLLREQLAAGRAQPAVVVDLVLDQLAAQSAAGPDESPLLAAFARFPDAVPPPDRARLHQEAVAAYRQHFVPSWKRFETFLSETYRPGARPQIAFTSLPDGPDAYATMIRLNTTTELSAQEIHELGLREVERITKEMAAVAREAGFAGPVEEFERQLAAAPGMRFASQQEMLAYARDVLGRIRPELPRLFGRLPRTTVDVRPIPPDREAASASSYTPGTPDGSRPAWFNLNTYQPHERVKYPIEPLVLHETLPGHHLQVGLARELEDVPEFRRAIRAPAFTEGWALYAEWLGHELGTVYREPATRFGQLSTEQFRAVRLVVDTGMHAMGWSRDRAREYFRRHASGQSLAEIDRYIARPGQALAYKLGELKIKELRRTAERELGDRFDVRAFHEAVLRNGALPLDLLEDQVKRYIEGARSSRN